MTAAAAEARTVPLQVRVIGNVEPYSTVSVKAQVGGELVKVFFEEGRNVRKGDKLFQIDPRPYELALKQAEAALAKDMALVNQARATLARDIAQADNAAADAARYARLMSEGIISKEVNDNAHTNAKALAEAVAADRAALESARTTLNWDQVAIDTARLNLSYSLIVSPIEGRTGPVLTKEGNLIKANADTGMVVIHQVRPIYVAFSVPEDRLAAIRERMAERSLEVEATVPGNSPQSSRGALTFVDNTVDRVTGTIRLKATFPNVEGRLWPGQFLDVALTLTNEQNVTVVPAEAVQSGPQGQFVYVVQKDQKVAMRPVTVGRGVERFLIIENGVSPGETVVTDGQLRLVPGAAVQVISASGGQPPAPAGEAAPR